MDLVATSPPSFSGAAVKLQEADIDAAAATLGCDVPAVKAVLKVETGGSGGFLTDGSNRPAILFEAEVFSQLTGGQYDATHPDISSAAWDPGLYVGGAGEYDRLAEAYALNPTAALQSASWGLFQVMGANFSVCGYLSVQDFVAAMVSGEPKQLDAFVSYCLYYDLEGALAAHDWASFAAGYNGPAYAANQYDQKLEAAWIAAGGTPPAPAFTRTVRFGASGAAVKAIQAALVRAGWVLSVDGDFGSETEAAVRQFQAANSLSPDGEVGRQTWAALGL